MPLLPPTGRFVEAWRCRRAWARQARRVFVQPAGASLLHQPGEAGLLQSVADGLEGGAHTSAVLGGSVIAGRSRRRRAGMVIMSAGSFREGAGPLRLGHWPAAGIAGNARVGPVIQRSSLLGG